MSLSLTNVLGVQPMRGPLRLLVAGLLLGGCTPTEPMKSTDMAVRSMPDLIDCKANPTSCGKCGVDVDCMAPTPRCDVPTGRCVACLPTSDNCGGGMICVDADGFGKYECLGACRIDTDCIKLAGGGICCGGACRNTTNDVTNCGACGRVCAQYPNAANRCAGGTCSMGACNAGFLDCNQRDTDGCEVAANDDITNCGACGAACPRIVGGTTVCAMGVCSSSCNIGQLDCDNDLKNGCEADSTSDPKNCGKCGTACTAPAHAVPACDSSKCSFRCLPHFFDCNNDPADGCEVDASADTKNCGHCGSVCPNLPNASPACVNSLCTAGMCANGFGDCDLKPGNGCEAALATDTSNCGACGKGCKSINGNAVCAMGACTLTCTQGFSDCNNDPSDGCEANFKIDPKNCGACGVVCPLNTPYCNTSMCSAQPNLVGQYDVNSGPYWANNPPTYTCQEACALLFGGQAGTYMCSTVQGVPNRMANTSIWSITVACTLAPDTFKKNTFYDCGATNCSQSAYVQDNCRGGINYCYR